MKAEVKTAQTRRKLGEKRAQRERFKKERKLRASGSEVKGKCPL